VAYYQRKNSTNLIKRVSTISLLLLLFYTQLGYYGQFLILQWRMKEAAREAWISALPDTAFFRVALTEANARGKWEEAGKECWINDHLYDVIRQKTIDGKTWLFCFDDDNEERLIRGSGEFAHAGHDQPDKRTAHAFSVRFGDAVCDMTSLRISRPPATFSTWYCSNPNPLPIRYREITVPPPKG
jgi:hypothetical protein